MDQAQLTSIFSARPENFGWFLGAGTSASAGLRTATDIIWDLKRRHYCRQENQDISRQDIQNEAVRQRIQGYMESNGFPLEGAENEFTGYFERIFGDDKERQRRYISATLAENKIRLSVGSRVLWCTPRQRAPDLNLLSWRIRDTRTRSSRAGVTIGVNPVGYKNFANRIGDIENRSIPARALAPAPAATTPPKRNRGVLGKCFNRYSGDAVTGTS